MDDLRNFPQISKMPPTHLDKWNDNYFSYFSIYATYAP